MIKGILFDLDYCILDNRTLPAGIIDSVLAPLFSSDLPEDRKKEIRETLRGNALEPVLREQQVPEPVADSMRHAYRELELASDARIKTYGDEGVISSLPTKNILVTSGYRKFQQSKIDLLEIGHLFAYSIIDANDDSRVWKGKERIFAEILKQEGWSPDEVLVLGDNPKSELSAGKTLGIKTVQTLRPGVKKWDGADYHIKVLSELAALVQ